MRISDCSFYSFRDTFCHVKKPYMEFFGAWWLVGAAMLFNSVFGVYMRQGIPMTPKNGRVLAYSLNMNFVDEMPVHSAFRLLPVLHHEDGAPCLDALDRSIAVSNFFAKLEAGLFITMPSWFSRVSKGNRLLLVELLIGSCLFLGLNWNMPFVFGSVDGPWASMVCLASSLRLLLLRWL